jgi:hypothetical protein
LAAFAGFPFVRAIFQSKWCWFSLQAVDLIMKRCFLYQGPGAELEQLIKILYDKQQRRRERRVCAEVLSTLECGIFSLSVCERERERERESARGRIDQSDFPAKLPRCCFNKTNGRRHSQVAAMMKGRATLSCRRKPKTSTPPRTQMHGIERCVALLCGQIEFWYFLSGKLIFLPWRSEQQQQSERGMRLC